MTGHWTYEGSDEEFYNKDEMWQYIRENEYYYDELDFERWLDDNYSASQIYYRARDDGAEQAIYDLMDEFDDDWYDDAGEPTEGEDFDFNDFIFTWVEADDNEEDE